MDCWLGGRDGRGGERERKKRQDKLSIYGWMVSWMNGWMGGWMRGRKVRERRAGQTLLHECVDQMDGWTDR